MFLGHRGQGSTCEIFERCLRCEENILCYQLFAVLYMIVNFYVKQIPLLLVARQRHIYAFLCCERQKLLTNFLCKEIGSQFTRDAGEGSAVGRPI